jgi:hypothetical protein
MTSDGIGRCDEIPGYRDATDFEINVIEDKPRGRSSLPTLVIMVLIALIALN